MKVCGDSGFHLFEQKENLTVGRQVRVTFAATIFQLTATKNSAAKIAGFSSKLVLKKPAVPSNHASPTPKQVNEARRRKRKLPLSNKQLRGEELSSVLTQETYTTPKRQSRALSKLTANRV